MHRPSPESQSAKVELGLWEVPYEWMTILQSYTEVMRKYTYACDWHAECKLRPKEWRYWKWVWGNIISEFELLLLPWYMIYPSVTDSIFNSSRYHGHNKSSMFFLKYLSVLLKEKKCINSFLPFTGEQKKEMLVVETLHVEVFPCLLFNNGNACHLEHWTTDGFS